MQTGTKSPISCPMVSLYLKLLINTPLDIELLPWFKSPHNLRVRTFASAHLGPTALTHSFPPYPPSPSTSISTSILTLPTNTIPNHPFHLHHTLRDIHPPSWRPPTLSTSPPPTLSNSTVHTTIGNLLIFFVPTSHEFSNSLIHIQR